MKAAVYGIAVALLVTLVTIACSDPESEQTGPPDSQAGRENSGGSIPATSIASTSGAVGDAGQSSGPTAEGSMGAPPNTSVQGRQSGEPASGRTMVSPPATGAQATPPTASATPTPTPQPQDPTKPRGYYLGSGHGLAIVQTARQTNERREGWVDITLNLVAIKFDDGELTVNRRREPNSICFEGSEGSADCLMVKWGSEEQYEADLTGTGNRRSILLDDSKPLTPKAVNLGVAFQVPSNATRASIFFGDNQIPLKLDGDYAPKEDYDDPQTVPTAPPSQDPKTAGFFMDSEHGIAVTGVSRAIADEGSAIPVVSVELSVLSLGDYDPSTPGPGEADGPGNVCFGEGGSECLQIFWGAEDQFDAILYLEGEDEFARARSAGTRWPSPLTVQFRAPHNHDSTVLKFGSHRIPLDLRGMKGDGPAFDYTAHYPEAVPGSVLYESDGKTVVLDAVRHDPSRGHLELAMTARNDNEASDFTPAFSLVGIFSAMGKVNREEVSSFRRSTPTGRGENLAPGQSASLQFTVPRVGNEEWGYVAYSPDPVKRTDGVVFQIVDGSLPANRRQTSAAPLPRFVRFDRAEDERSFFAGRTLWRYEDESRLRFPTFTDRALYALSDDGILALDVDTGEQIWQYNPGQAVSKPIVADGVVYVASGGTVHTLDANTGEQLWQFKPDDGRSSLPTPAEWRGVCANQQQRSLRLEVRHRGTALAVQTRCWYWWGYSGRDGVVFMALYDTIHALDAISGKEVWQLKPSRYEIRLSTVAGGVVYVFEGTTSLIAVDAATGQELWSRRDRSRLPPIVEGGRLYEWAIKRIPPSRYYAGGSNATGLTVLEPKTRELLWHLELNARHFGLLADEGVVFTVLGRGNSKVISARDPATGEQLWRSGFTITSDGGIIAVADGVVYAMSDGLKALSAATGELLWQANDVDSTSSPTVLDGVMYGSSGGYMYAIIVGGSR